MIYGEAVSPKTVEPRVNPFTRQWTWILLAAAIASLVVKGLLAWNTLGTNDILALRENSQEVAFYAAFLVF
jgi:hypothetical protein